MRRIFWQSAAWMLSTMIACSGTADEAEKYTLRYKFQPGELVRWEVEHRSNVRTAMSGTTKDVDTVSLS